MYKIKEKLKTLYNLSKQFIKKILNDPIEYIIYNQIPTLILTIFLKCILKHYLPDAVSEQIISIAVKVLNLTIKIIVKNVFKLIMKTIWLVFVYDFIKTIFIVLMKHSKINKKHKIKVYIGLGNKIVYKHFNYGGNIIKIPP